MKILISTIILGLMSFYSSTETCIISKKRTFKTITEASYCVKESGELTRKSLDRKSFYDNDGELIEYWDYVYVEDSLYYEKVKLEKNKQGKLIKKTAYSCEGNLKSYTNTKFDNYGNIVQYKSYNKNNELTSTESNEYDSNGNLLSISLTITSSNKTFKITSKYNSKNQLIEEIDFKPDGSIEDVRTFKYDNMGNEIKSDLTRSNGEYTKFVSEYDKNNNVISEYWFDKDGSQKHWNSFSYEYDENNNWVTRKRYSNNRLDCVWERKIEYN
ncbi:hypothetical protein [Aquimarina algicola]|uniref:RHS repeat protein n=1 Tax=Aquimarina algicola TaxID=2589995 RepID=A0A504JGG5_9FLAO|nr:hypothetical protein [Aquimarina algicola]TPN86848.1 hypothetical protein FHK87_04395 [Aquimarina algicola]